MTEQRVSYTLDSSLETIDNAEEKATRIATELGFPDDEIMQISMAVREAAVNAVLHGNAYAPDKKVILVFERTGGDLIITHEFGHALASEMGTDTPVNWLNELIASYATYAYVKGARPDLAEPLELFYIYAATFSREHSSLRYLDAHYSEIAASAPMNYGWYQGALFMQIMSVYQREGVAFLEKLRTDVQSHGRFLEQDALDRLEAISPGWKSWAADLEAQEH